MGKKYIDPTVVVTCTYSGSQKGKAFAKDGFVLIDDRPKTSKHGKIMVELVYYMKVLRKPLQS